MAVTFYFFTRPDKKGDYPIYTSIYLNGSRFCSSIGYSISPEKWDDEKMKVKHGASNLFSDLSPLLRQRERESLRPSGRGVCQKDRNYDAGKPCVSLREVLHNVDNQLAAPSFLSLYLILLIVFTECGHGPKTAK